MTLGYNRILGASGAPDATQPHRIALGQWPTSISDPRTASLGNLLGFVQQAGYEGLEFHISGYTRYFPDESLPTVAAKAKQALAKHHLKNFGATIHCTDEQMRSLDFLKNLREELKTLQLLDCEYASYQLNIHPKYENTAGLWREDERYLQWCASTVKDIRTLTWEMGLNCYIEIHVGRITEDPAALCRIMEIATCELNGDMSHFLARGFLAGKYIEKLQSLVGHTHVRMCRTLGDLSANVPNPKEDWASKGVTWQMFQFMLPCLKGGLSSRTIVGESGPMHLVTDTLTLDASLVPLYRAMARVADAFAQGMEMKITEPADLLPWG